MTRRLLVMRARLLRLVHRLGGAAAPIAGPRQRGRVGDAGAHAREVLGGAGGILEEAQRDPARRELVLDPVVFLGRRHGFPHHSIGRRGVADVEKLARDQPALDPPLVGVDDLGDVARRPEHVLGGLGDLVGAAQQLNVAEQEAGIPVGARRQILEQRLGIRSLRVERRAHLRNSRLDTAETIGGAQRSPGVVGVEAAFHAGLFIRPGDEVAEGAEDLLFGVARQRFGTPGIADQRLRAGTVALGEQGAAERKASLGGNRPVAGEGADGGEVGLFLPQHGFGPPAEHRDAGPARIGCDESLETGEIGAILVAAQDRPFDQLTGDRIGDPLLHLSRVFGLATTGIFDRLPHRCEVRGRRGHHRRQFLTRRGHIRRREGGQDGAGGGRSLMSRNEARSRPRHRYVPGAGRRRLAVMGGLLGRLIGRHGARCQREDAGNRTGCQPIPAMMLGQSVPRPDKAPLPLVCKG